MGRSMLWMVLIVPWARASDAGAPQGRGLAEMSIEELATIEITSKLSRTPAAVYVISHEEIRRSGAGSIPELLRMVPGLQVARLDAHRWVVTARGFADQFSNKLLVLIDGRSVYTTQFSGVYWDERDTLLEDIDRIEVIRGPGATMWGANAVNGVINIITLPAQDTQGLLLSAGTASEERGAAEVRYGFRAGPKLHARVFGKYFSRGEFEYPSGLGAKDDWSAGRGGFRLDWGPNARDTLTLEGDIYGGRANHLVSIAALLPPFGQTILDSARLQGGSLLGRWQRRFSENSELGLDFYYDESHRDDSGLSFAATHIANFDLQHRWRRARHELTWGLGHRVTRDWLEKSFTVEMAPPARTDQLFNAFAQDEIELVEDRLALSFGSKVEHNGYTGFEVEPSARLMWTPGARQGFWGAVSRAVRTPSRSDCCIRLNVAAVPGPQGLSLLSVFGSAGFQSEHLRAHEAGYRIQPARWLSLDATGFYNVYGGVMSEEQTQPFFESLPAPAHLVIPLRIVNGIGGSTHGLEIATKWQPASRWQLEADYTWFRSAFRQSAAVQGDAEILENSSPHHQAHFHSYLNLPARLEFDTGLYYVDSVREYNIPYYLRADVRVGWRAWRGLEVSAGGENLLDRRHTEFCGHSSGIPEAIAVPRNLYLKLTWRFE